MLNKTLFCALIVAILLCACGQRMDKRQLAIIDAGFTRSDQFIKEQNDELLALLVNRLNVATTKSYAQLWTPVAKRIRSLTDSVDGYLVGLSSGLKNGDNLGHDRERQLLEALRRYKGQLLVAFDTVVRQRHEYVKVQIAEMEPYWPLLKDSSIRDGGPAINLQLLNKLRIDSRLTEHHLLQYCVDQSVLTTDHFDRQDFIVGLSSTHITAGESIILFSGLGAFSLEADPKITVDGRLIKVDSETGVAKDTLSATSQVGKHKIQVDIEYSRPDGTRVTASKSLTFRVFPEH
jgi:hypothetical protein